MNDLKTEYDSTERLAHERIAREIGVDESVVSSIAARLRLVRGDLSDSGFFSLVRVVVSTKMRLAERDGQEDVSVVRFRPRAD